MRNRSALTLLATAAALLAGCHKNDGQPPENRTREAPAPAPAVPAAAPAPPPKPEPAQATPKPKAAPKPSADQQMLDDADATGMTSHSGGASNAEGGSGNEE